MENNIYNAIVQGEYQDTLAPGAELKEAMENEQSQKNDGAFVNLNATVNEENTPASQKTNDKNPSAFEMNVINNYIFCNREDTEAGDDVIAVDSKVQIDTDDIVSDVQNDIGIVNSDIDNQDTNLKEKKSHISFSIEEAMRKIMNLTAEIKDTDKSDVTSDEEKDKEEPSLENPDNAPLFTINNPDVSHLPKEKATDEFLADIVSESISEIDGKDEGKKVDIANDSTSLYDEMYDSDIADYDDDDGYILEDEFGNIPESFFDEDIDDDSSLSSLLYDDDDVEAESDFEISDNVSFTQLKQEMQKIKNNAMELHAVETQHEVESEEITTEEVEVEDSSDTVEVTDDEAVENTEPEIEEAPEVPKVSQVRKIYTRDIEETNDDSPKEEIKEQVITIDRARIREKSVPEGRLIDTIFEVVETITFSVLFIMLILSSFIFRYSEVSGESMYPTFNDGDKLIISKLLYTPKRGDVVVFDDRSNEIYENDATIKRIIALEGDTVKIEDSIIYVMEYGSDDFVIVDYVDGMDIPSYDMQPIVVPKGEMFVMGDNVNHSMDSREVGTIKVESIIGKVILRFYTMDNYYSEETQEEVKNGHIVFDTKF